MMTKSTILKIRDNLDESLKRVGVNFDSSSEEDDDVDTLDRAKILAIGDPHFRIKYIIDGKNFVEKCVEVAKSLKPDAIVILGDVLDTNEVARLQPYKLACEFIDRLSNISKTYVLIGNHDYSNQTQFLTDNHFFTPLKRWNNVTIVDRAIKVLIRDASVIMCPYTPPGMLKDALITIDEREDLEGILLGVKCVFCHQEIRGCVMSRGSVLSGVGDVWSEAYPPIVSGHIHDESTVGTNVYYVGTPMQIDFDESEDKGIWNIIIGGETLVRTKIDLGLKKKRIVRIPIEDVNTYVVNDSVHTRLELVCKSEQYKVFRKSSAYKKLTEKGVIVRPIISEQTYEIRTDSTRGANTSYKGFVNTLKDIVDTKSEEIRLVHDEVLSMICSTQLSFE